MFWSTHNPCRRSYSRQYNSAVLYQSEEQKKLALESKAKHEKGFQIFTEIAPLDKFYIAEDYHQKYMLRNSERLMQEFQAMYPNDADFVNSTAAARLNCFVAGNGSAELLKSEIDSYGLSPESAKLLLRSVRAESALTK